MSKKFIIAVFLFFTVQLCFSQIHKGVYNIIDFPEKGVLVLNGEWKFYPDKLLKPEEVDGADSGEPVYLNVPGTWNSQGLNGRGYGTYRLKLINVPEGRMIGFAMPNVYSSYKLYINEHLVAENGQVGTEINTSVPQWKMGAFTFIPDHPVVYITLQVSNFDHFFGGIHKQLSIGTFDTVQRIKENNLLANMLLFGGLAVLGIFCIMIFTMQYQSERYNVLFFGLLCIAWAIRSFFANIYLKTVFFPEFDWNISIRLEYIFMFVSLILGNLFIKTSFNIREHISFYFVMVINSLMILITVIFQPVVFSSLLYVYLIIAMLNLIYLSALVLSAIIKNHKEAWYSGVSIVLAIVIFLTDLIAHQQHWQMDQIILNTAYLLVFMLNSLVLAYQVTKVDKTLEELEREQITMFKIS
ncbi:MAG: 7TM diverse intracellular signaling domain-containing protein [Candidatus Cyclobacteriaceae bacterium M2_1C_046]